MRLSRHAEMRMAERNISLADVSSVIDDSDVTFADPKGNPVLHTGDRRPANQGSCPRTIRIL